MTDDKFIEFMAAVNIDIKNTCFISYKNNVDYINQSWLNIRGRKKTFLIEYRGRYFNLTIDAKTISSPNAAENFVNYIKGFMPETEVDKPDRLLRQVNSAINAFNNPLPFSDTISLHRNNRSKQ